MLDFELVHATSVRLLEFVHLFVELLADLDFELVIQVLVDVDRRIIFFDLVSHSLD